MAAEFTTKVRLVRCPKCRLLLQEVPDFQVYRCGGCGAILQAKNRLNGLRSRSTGLNGTVAAQMNGLDGSSEDKASSSTSSNGIHPDSGECSSNRIDEKNQSKSSGECSFERNTERDESKCLEGSESSSSSLKGKTPALEECSLERNEGDGSCSSEGIESSSSSHKVILPESGEHSLIQNNGMDPDKLSVEDDGGEQLRELNIPIENQNYQSDQNGFGEPGKEPLGVPREISSTMEFENSVPIRLDRLKSSNTFETTDFLSPRSEFSAAVNDRSKSPETRSHHAYDGSVSSYDGTYDQFYNHNLHTLQDAYTAPKLVQSKERFRREKFLAESMGNRGSGLPNQARSTWSSMSGKNGHAMKYRNPDQDEMLPPRIPCHPSRDHARVKRDEYMPRVASLEGDSLGGYGNGRFRNQMHNELQSNSNYQSDRSVSTAADKLTLLRMVCELQTQVNNLNVQASRQEKHIPQYHNYDTSEEELFHGLNHPRDLRRSRAGSHYVHQQSQYRPIPFSSEATTSRHQVDSPFMHHYPEDRQFSAPLPLLIRSNTNGLRRVHPGYASSQWDSETVSEDQIHNSHEVKCYGEKQQMPKRHFRPLAGGAPILICYNCFKPLQIPADFLLFKRKCHRLQCGACSKVLKFSLRKRTHILPYGVNAIGPPPSEVEDHSYCVNADPVSCSDDYGYGLSYYKSGSTEAGDHAGNIALSNSLESTIVHERNMSYGSDNPRGRQEIVLRSSQSQNKDRNLVERFMSARTSSNKLKSNKHSSEMELPPKLSSPLHRLMGYRSPSQVIRGIGFCRTGSKNSGKN